MRKPQGFSRTLPLAAALTALILDMAGSAGWAGDLRPVIQPFGKLKWGHGLPECFTEVKGLADLTSLRLLGLGGGGVALRPTEHHEPSGCRR